MKSRDHFWRLHFLVWQVVRRVPPNPNPCRNNKYAVSALYSGNTDESLTFFPLYKLFSSFLSFFFLIKAGFGQLELCDGAKLCKMLNRPECALMRVSLNHLKCLCFKNLRARKKKIRSVQLKSKSVDLNVQVNVRGQLQWTYATGPNDAEIAILMYMYVYIYICVCIF